MKSKSVPESLAAKLTGGESLVSLKLLREELDFASSRFELLKAHLSSGPGCSAPRLSNLDTLVRSEAHAITQCLNADDRARRLHGKIQALDSESSSTAFGVSARFVLPMRMSGRELSRIEDPEDLGDPELRKKVLSVVKYLSSLQKKALAVELPVLMRLTVFETIGTFSPEGATTEGSLRVHQLVLQPRFLALGSVGMKKALCQYTPLSSSGVLTALKAQLIRKETFHWDATGVALDINDLHPRSGRSIVSGPDSCNKRAVMFSAVEGLADDEVFNTERSTDTEARLQSIAEGLEEEAHVISVLRNFGPELGRVLTNLSRISAHGFDRLNFLCF